MYDGIHEYDAPPPGKGPPPPPYGDPPSYGGYPHYGGYDPYASQFAAPPPAPSNNVFQISNNAGDGLAPGMCTVCRNGMMEDSASGWTWIMCFICCIIGIFPGCIAFCCCFRKPKCTKCGYTVG